VLLPICRLLKQLLRRKTDWRALIEVFFKKGSS